MNGAFEEKMAGNCDVPCIHIVVTLPITQTMIQHSAGYREGNGMKIIDDSPEKCV